MDTFSGKSNHNQRKIINSFTVVAPLSFFYNILLSLLYLRSDPCLVLEDFTLLHFLFFMLPLLWQIFSENSQLRNPTSKFVFSVFLIRPRNERALSRRSSTSHFLDLRFRTRFQTQIYRYINMGSKSEPTKLEEVTLQYFVEFVFHICLIFNTSTATKSSKTETYFLLG